MHSKIKYVTYEDIDFGKIERKRYAEIRITGGKRDEFEFIEEVVKEICYDINVLGFTHIEKKLDMEHMTYRLYVHLKNINDYACIKEEYDSFKARLKELQSHKIYKRKWNVLNWGDFGLV